MLNKKISTPKLYPLDLDLKKTWFVKYQDVTGRPLKAYGKMASFHILEDRLAEAKRVMQEIVKPSEKNILNRNSLIKNLSDLLEDRRPSLGEKTYQDYFSLIKKFAEWYNLERVKNKDVCPSGFVRHCFEKQHHKNYIYKIVVVFKSFFKTLAKNNLYSGNPFLDITARRIKGQSKLPFSQQQKAALKAVIKENDKQLWHVCEMLFYTYMRPEELRKLKIEDIVADAGLIYVRNDIAKDYDCEAVVIPTQLLPFINEILQQPSHYYFFGKNGMPGEKPLSKNNLNGRHRKFTKMLNFGKRFTLYSWVHTGIKEAAMSGIPIKQLQMQKRHHSLDMFNEYLKDLRVEDNAALRYNFPTA